MIFGLLEFQWWLENFLGIDANWSRFHWGLALERRQHLNEPGGEAKVDFAALEFLWRAEPGFNLVDNTWGLTLPLQMIQGESASAMIYGVGGFISQKPPAWLENLMSWSELKLQYYLGSSGSDMKVKSAYSLIAQGYRSLTTNVNLRYGVEVRDYKYDPSVAKENIQMGLNFGAYWRF
jgi:hypothetical protein